MKIAVAGTGYVGLSNAILLSQHNEVYAVDVIQSKVDLINSKKSPIIDKEISEYLSEKTIERIQELDVEADEVIKDGKIDDVLYYFEKLEQSEKEECMRKLQNLM